MSALSRQSALSLSRLSHAAYQLAPLRTRTLSASARRAAEANPTSPSTSTSTSTSTPANDDPLPVPPVVFPVPKDPFQRTAGEQRRSQTVSETRVAIARGLARLMGYNSKASTAIRETSRIMKGIVEAVEKDKEFWYGECGLPPTYQSFFQIHLLYILITIPRLRALPASMAVPNSPIPESQEPAEPTSPALSTPTSPITATTTHTASARTTSTTLSSTAAPATAPAATPSPSNPSTPSSPEPSPSAPSGYFSKPHYQIYPSELINHFFELAEGQMRKVLGRGERERVVKQYMQEMGQQWKGASVALDYVLGLSMSEDQARRDLADAELAAWVWRNLFASRGMPLPGIRGAGAGAGSAGAGGARAGTGAVSLAPGPVEMGGYVGEAKEVELAQCLERIVYWIRREMKRLEDVSHEDLVQARIGEWGSPTTRTL